MELNYLIKSKDNWQELVNCLLVLSVAKELAYRLLFSPSFFTAIAVLQNGYFAFTAAQQAGDILLVS